MKINKRVHKLIEVEGDEEKTEPSKSEPAGADVHTHDLVWKNNELIGHGKPSSGEDHKHDIVQYADGKYELVQTKGRIPEENHTHEVIQQMKKDLNMKTETKASKILVRLKEEEEKVYSTTTEHDAGKVEIRYTVRSGVSPGAASASSIEIKSAGVEDDVHVTADDLDAGDLNAFKKAAAEAYNKKKKD